MYYPLNVMNARLDVVAAAIDAGPGPGYIEIGTAGMGAVLVSIPLPSPCAYAADWGELSFALGSGITGIASTSGTAGSARIRNAGGEDVVLGLTVGGSGADIVLSNTAISANGLVTIAGLYIYHS